MNTKDYIESGILELYVMGKLSEAESREVAQNIAKYPEIKAEVDAIEAAVEEYAMLHKIQPGNGGFDAILKRINKNKDTGSDKKGGAGFLPFLTAALAILSAIALILLWNNNNTHQGQMNALQIQLDTCAQSLTQAQSQVATQNQIILQLQGRQTIYMDGRSPGTNKAPLAVAAVIWNETTNEFSVDPLSLPDTPSDKDYQLWAIVDGAPVDMIVFNTDKDPSEVTSITFDSRPTAFAVTLEPKGGSEAPTLSEMYVLGALQG